MKFWRWLPLCVAVLGLAGCGTPIAGKLYSLGDATTLQFEIETSMGTGAMRATNPKTGEKFAGQYTGIRKTRTVLLPAGSGRDQPPSPGESFLRGMHGALGTGNSAVIIPSYATARGVLAGDKGTMIELFMEIQPGVRPTGHGEGTDNKGGRYQVQF